MIMKVPVPLKRDGDLFLPIKFIFKTQTTFMKFILLLFLLATGYYINAQDIPPPPVADSMAQYSKDTVGIFEKVEVEASYPGGEAAWKKFLERNLNANAPIKDVPRRTKYFEQTAICQFIVCKDGSICDIKVIN